MAGGAHSRVERPERKIKIQPIHLVMLFVFVCVSLSGVSSIASIVVPP
jgi:hypothetical protein